MSLTRSHFAQSWFNYANKVSLKTLKKLLYQTIKEGKNPNVITFNTMIDGLCKEGKLGDGMKLFFEMSNKNVVEPHFVIIFGVKITHLNAYFIIFRVFYVIQIVIQHKVRTNLMFTQLWLLISFL